MNYIILPIVVALMYGHLFYSNTPNKLDNRYYPKVIKDESKSVFLKPKQQLLKTFQEMSSFDKVSLSGPCESKIYTEHTLYKKLKENIQYLLTQIIQRAKDVGCQNYVVGDIEEVYIQKDKYNNLRYVVQTNIYDQKNYYNLKIVVDIVVIHGLIYINYVGLNPGSNTTLLNRYDRTIFSRGVLENQNMFQKNLGEILSSYYKKYYKVKPSNQFTEDLDNLVDDHFYTIPSKIIYSNNPEYWEMGKGYDKRFCNQYYDSWDPNGVLIPKSSECSFNQRSVMKPFQIPDQNPTQVVGRTYGPTGGYSWLSDQRYGQGNKTTRWAP
jgi:rRNA processing protein Gar1